MENLLPKYEPSGFALQIFKDRYAISPEESYQEACRRVANFIASAEDGEKIKQFEERFFEIMSTNRFSPGGRIWRGAGRKRNGMINCFLLPSGDSAEEWGELLKNVTIISSMGGGIGISFDNVRYRGAPIRGKGGEATGAISLMQMVDGICKELRSGAGRRSALLFGLSYWHPDVEEFLNIKLDKKELNNANISILVDNKFFDLVESDGDIELKWQDKTIKTIKAKWLYDKVIENSLQTGDPGFLNIGNAEKYNNLYYCRTISCSNPCFTSDMRLHTSDGIITLKELYDTHKDNSVISDNRCDGKNINPEKIGITNKWGSPVIKTGENKQIYKLTDEHGHKIKCTEYHRFPTTEGIKELKNLKVGDILFLQSGEGGWGNIGDYEDGLILGLLAGDGSIKIKQKQCCLDLFGEDEPIIKKYKKIVNKKVNEWKKTNKEFIENKRWKNRFITTTITKDNKTGKMSVYSETLYRYLEDTFNIYVPSIKYRVPECIWHGSREAVIGYLHGIFATDGNAGTNKRCGNIITLSQSNSEFLRDIQILLNNFGILCRVGLTAKAGYHKFPGGNISWCKNQYQLRMTRSSAIKFQKDINFIGYKKTILSKRLKSFKQKSRSIIYKTKVKLIEKISVKDVYCLNQPETNTIIVNGVVTQQCGEQQLPPFSVCCLGNINLSTHVTEEGKINWGMLEDTIGLGVRFLDNVLDKNEYPIEIIKHISQQERRIGLGVMGLHHMLIKIGIKYSSEESIKVVDELFNFIKKKAYMTSIFLAVEKSQFPLLDRHKFIESLFCKNSLTPSIRKKIIEYGARNCCILTCPPTGTTSLVANTTSGIEPIFSPVHKRNFNKHNQNNHKELLASSEIIIDPLLKEFIESNKDISNFEGSHDISPECHCLIQKTIQKHIDSAVSKTINLPSEATEQDLSKIIIKYIRDLKGMTIYRDQSKGKSPLMPLPIKEAEKYLKEITTKVESSDSGCPSGKCDI